MKYYQMLTQIGAKTMPSYIGGLDASLHNLVYQAIMVASEDGYGV